MPSKFMRHLEPQILQDLKASDLFKNHLLPDIEQGKVFPALRNRRVDFYYGGGMLFSYSEKGFATHIKYAAAFDAKKDYVLETELQGLTPIPSFSQKGYYKRIKENCRNYAGVEAQGVFEVCKGFGQLFSGKSPTVIPLDVEIGFSGASDRGTDNEASPEMGKGKLWDRMDLLLYNTTSGQLRFAEAKHSSNPELWGTAKAAPAVAAQLTAYLNRINTQGNEIIQAYRDYVQSLNNLFETKVQEPSSFHPDSAVFLLVFGFDSVQRGPFLQKLLHGQNLSGYYYYSCGDPKNTTPDKIWQQVKKLP